MRPACGASIFASGTIIACKQLAAISTNAAEEEQGASIVECESHGDADLDSGLDSGLPVAGDMREPLRTHCCGCSESPACKTE